METRTTTLILGVPSLESLETSEATDDAGPSVRNLCSLHSVPWILYPRNIVVRTTVEPLSIVPEIRRQVDALDKDVPVSNIATMEEITTGPVQQGKAVMWLLGSLATLALVLFAMGVLQRDFL